MKGKIIAQKYQLVELIGEGSCGQIYLANDLNLQIPVAVKISKQDQNSCKALEQEKSILLPLDHCGIVKMKDFFTEDGISFLILEYIEGVSLRHYLEENGVVERTLAMRWMREIMEILQYLQEQKPAIIYRDLKPENLMIRSDQSIKLIDFGIAVKMGNQQERLRAGTYGYAAPEQLSEKRYRDLDTRADIYALGAVMYEILTGKNPGVPPYTKYPIRQLNSTISQSMDHIIVHCLEDNPDKRYRNIRELSEDIAKSENCEKKIRIQKHIQKKALLLSLGACAACIWFRLQWNGIYLYPLFALFYLISKLCGISTTSSQKFLRRQEHCIWYTAKKVTGVVLILCGFLFCSDFVRVSAAESANQRICNPVAIRNEHGDKILIKDGAIYYPRENIQLEVQLDQLPEETPLSVKVSICDNSGKCVGLRSFEIEVGKAMGKDQEK